jgi:hypothetical protein
MRNRERALVTAALVGVAATFGLAALALSRVAGRVPVWVAALTVALGIVQWSRDARDSAALPTADRGREVWLLSSTVGLVGALYVFGLLVTLPLAMAAYWRWEARAGWTASLAAALAVLSVLYLGVEVGLGVELHEGVLWTTFE